MRIEKIANLRSVKIGIGVGEGNATIIILYPLLPTPTVTPIPSPTPTMSASQKPIRLPPLKILRVRNPNGKRERPCMSVMSSVLGTY